MLKCSQRFFIIKKNTIKMIIRQRLLKRLKPICSRNCPLSHQTNPKWQTVVGLEVHAQINTKSKLFSSASTDFAGSVNSNTALFDAAIPGTLPVLNRECVRAAVFTALALNCRINPVSTFDRKHYFYADLPAGYQITQQYLPLATSGYMEFAVYNPSFHKKPYSSKARLKQIQLEQDSGRSLHDADISLVNLNRAGIPLMELVFEPDLKDGEEAAALVKELVIILQRLGTCTCKMEEGSLRVDANVSVNRVGEPLGTRTEIKNIGSIRGVAGAVAYEVQRQIKLLEEGGTVVNETRAWNAEHKTTVGMRDKEEKQDYRYMPEPNLPPLHVAVDPHQRGSVRVDDFKGSLPELPQQTRKTLVNEYGLTQEQALVIVNENKFLELFKSVEPTTPNLDFRLLANIITNDLMRLLNKKGIDLEDVTVTGEHLRELIVLLQSGVINRNVGRMVIQELLDGNTGTPKSIVNEKNWGLLGEDELRELCVSILNDNAKIVKQYKAGKTKVVGALLGIIANKSNQRADMSKVEVLLKEMLSKM